MTRPDGAVFAYCATAFGGASTGTCAVMNVVTDDAISGCTGDDECTLRWPGCCECDPTAQSTDVLAMRKDAVSNYTAAICGPVATPCPACAVAYPTGARAACDPTTHHCTVTR